MNSILHRSTQFPFWKLIVSSWFLILAAEAIAPLPSLSQNAQVNQSSTVGESSNFNQIMQNNQQVPVLNSNNFRFPNIFPLESPPFSYPNTENDFGFNLSAATNTLDASNVTVSFGIVYQPGRTSNHRARMRRLQKETELLETNKKLMEANLTLLQTQIQEAKLRLNNLQRSPR